MYQHESAVDIPMSPPFWLSLPPPTPFHPSRSSQALVWALPESQSDFLLAIYVTHGNVYVSTLLSQFDPPSPSLPAVSTSLFSMSVSPLRPCKLFHQYHLYRFHRYALVCDICFSLSDLLCFFTFLHRAWEVFALRTNFISICHGTWESYKYLKQKIISRLLINVPGIYLTVKKCEWMTGKNSWILLKSLFFFF